MVTTKEEVVTMKEEMGKAVLGSLMYDVLKSIAKALLVSGSRIWAIKKTITITLSGKVIVIVIVVVTFIAVVAAIVANSKKQV